MTKQELLIYILEHYGNVMLLTHDELMRLNKRDLELYLADLQREYGKATKPRTRRLNNA